MSCSRILNSIKGFKLRQPQWSNTTIWNSNQQVIFAPQDHDHHIAVYRQQSNTNCGISFHTWYPYGKKEVNMVFKSQFNLFNAADDGLLKKCASLTQTIQ